MSEHLLSTLIEGFDPTKAKEAETKTSDWTEIYAARQNDSILSGEVVGIEEKQFSDSEKDKKHCAVIWIGSVKGLIPLDYFGVESVQEMRRLIGTKIAFKIETLSREAEIFVGNRKKAVEQMADMTLRRISEGDEILAVVRQVFNSALIVDIGGIECRIPVGEISDGWLDDLRAIYKVGDHKKVKVLAIDKEKKSVQVSIKALLPNHWKTIEKDYEINNEYVGHVSGISEYGIFIELKEGISALAPHLRHETVVRGQKVLVRVLRIKRDEKKINARVTRILN